MTMKLEELEQRLAALEQEVRALRQMVQGPPPEETPAERGAQLLREARAGQAAFSAAVARAFAEMGIAGPAMSIEELQKLTAGPGSNADDNEVSRAIVEMREE